MYCTNCQSEDLRPHAIFCKACGFRLVASGPDTGQKPTSNTPDKAETRAAAVENHCHKCGALVSVGRRYCAACCGVPDNPVRSKQDVTGTPVAAGQAKPAAHKPASPTPSPPESAPPPKAKPAAAAKPAQTAVPPSVAEKPAEKVPQKQHVPPATEEQPVVDTVAAAPETPVQKQARAQVNKPADRIPDSAAQAVFDAMPPPLGPALGLLDDAPLPEIPRKRPKRHFQHWGLLMITTLLTLAALAAGGYYAERFDIESDTRAQSSHTEDRRAEPRMPSALIEKREATPLQASLHNPMIPPALPVGAPQPTPKPAREVAQNDEVGQAAVKQKATKPKAVKQKTIKQQSARKNTAAKLPARTMARHENKKQIRAKPDAYQPARNTPVNRADQSKPEQADQVEASPTPRSSVVQVDVERSQTADASQEAHDPSYMQRKEQELDRLLQQIP